MKSSTIRRSTLSKETMEVIENLSKEEQETNSLPEEYVRPEEQEKQITESNNNSKAQEIDLLWQSVKSVQFNTKSPMAYIATGFLSGFITAVVILACIGMFASNSDINPTKSVSVGLSKLNIFGNKKVQKDTIDQETDIQNESFDKKVSVPNEENVLVTTSAENSDENTNTNVEVKKYIVKDGDTGEAIIKKYYGAWSQEKADLVMKANNLTNLDRINIGQELIIPISE